MREVVKKEVLKLYHAGIIYHVPHSEWVSPVQVVPKKGVKALVWFWIIDETLVLTSMLSVCRLNKVGTCQVMEQVMIMVMMVMTVTPKI